MFQPATIKDFESLISKEPTKLCCIHFAAAWAQPCLQVDQFFELQDNTKISCIKVDVEKLPELAHEYSIKSVPSIVFVRNESILTIVVGAKLDQLQELVVKYSDASFKLPNPKDALNDRLKSLINSHHVMVFIKGTPKAPRCGFTATLLKKLSELNIEFSYFDILSDEQVRQGLKEYSQWPTYPQIYINGELVGGLDIFVELADSQQLDSILNP